MGHDHLPVPIKSNRGRLHMLQRNAIDETHCSHLLSNGMGAHRAAKFRTGVHHEYDCVRGRTKVQKTQDPLS